MYAKYGQNIYSGNSQNIFKSIYEAQCLQLLIFSKCVSLQEILNKSQDYLAYLAANKLRKTNNLR